MLEESQKMQILKKVFDTIRTNSVVQKFISEYILYYNTPQVAVSKFESLNDYYQYTKKTYRTLLRNGEYNLTVKSY